MTFDRGNHHWNDRDSTFASTIARADAGWASSSEICARPWVRQAEQRYFWQRHILRPASGSSVPDRSTGAPSTNSEVPIHCAARIDPEQRRSSAQDDLRGPNRQDKTRRTAELGHSSDGPSCIDPAEIRVCNNGITLRALSQPTSATKSATTGLMHRSKEALFNHFVGASEQHGRQRNSAAFCYESPGSSYICNRGIA